MFQSTSLSAARTTLFVLTTFVLAVHSFIPAVHINSTEGLGTLEGATLNAFWFPRGQLILEANRTLAVPGSDGIAQGALVHFAESPGLTGTGVATKTPWIALISCDANSTSASSQDDVFASAKSRGAVAGLMYSLFSDTCLLNQAYKNGSAPAMDIFLIQTRDSARLLESMFNNINSTRYGSFDAQTLDSEFENITTFQSSSFEVDPGYLVVDMVAHTPIFTSTITSLPSTATSTNSPQSSSTTASNSNSSSVHSPAAGSGASHSNNDLPLTSIIESLAFVFLLKWMGQM